MINLKNKDSVAAKVEEILQQEALKGQQHQIDKNKNKKIDAQDFAILRGEKKAEVKEAAKPDFLDMDKDGDKKEPMKQAVKQAKMKKEEIEQIDEISKETLSSYASKAKAKANQMASKHHEIVKKDLATGDFTASKKSHAKIAKLDKGVLKAGQKLQKKAADAHAVATQGPKKPSNQFKTPPQGYKAPGSDRPYWGEDVEQIDELSKGTLGSYVKSATKDFGASRKLASDFEHNAKSARKPITKAVNTRLADRFKATAMKRHAGIDKAVNRLTKEEVEQMDEREMTKGETAERERIVKGMKKSFSGFRARYGDKAKSVMYATATKQAMKEEEQLAEKDDPCWSGYTMVGMKKKGGRDVPNCVPAKGVTKAKGFKEEAEEVKENSPFDWKKPRPPESKGGSGVKAGRAYGGAAQKSKPEQEDEKKK